MWLVLKILKAGAIQSLLIIADHEIDILRILVELQQIQQDLTIIDVIDLEVRHPQLRKGQLGEILKVWADEALGVDA